MEKKILDFEDLRIEKNSASFFSLLYCMLIYTHFKSMHWVIGKKSLPYNNFNCYYVCVFVCLYFCGYVFICVHLYLSVCLRLFECVFFSVCLFSRLLVGVCISAILRFDGVGAANISEEERDEHPHTQKKREKKKKRKRKFSSPRKTDRQKRRG